MTSRDRFPELVATLRETALFASCSNLLSWDEQTYLPHKGAAHRAEQLALLAGLTHDRATSPGLGELLNELEAGATSPHDQESPRGAVIRELPPSTGRSSCHGDSSKSCRIPRRSRNTPGSMPANSRISRRFDPGWKKRSP
jgi:hypothetical protein